VCWLTQQKPVREVLQTRAKFWEMSTLLKNHKTAYSAYMIIKIWVTDKAENGEKS
jgi:hypothetical protein